MKIEKKYLYFAIGLVSIVLTGLLLWFIIQPFFIIEGDMYHGILSEYYAPGNFVCIILIPSILIFALSYLSYHFMLKKSEAFKVNYIVWLVSSILITFADLFMLVMYCSFDPIWGVCGGFTMIFDFYILWKGYSISFKHRKDGKAESKEEEPKSEESSTTSE